MGSPPGGPGVVMSGDVRGGPTLASLPMWLFAVCYSLLTAFLLRLSPLLALAPIVLALALVPLLRAPRNAALIVV